MNNVSETKIYAILTKFYDYHLFNVSLPTVFKI